MTGWRDACTELQVMLSSALSILRTLLDYDANGQSVIKIDFWYSERTQKRQFGFSKSEFIFQMNQLL